MTDTPKNKNLKLLISLVILIVGLIVLIINNFFLNKPPNREEINFNVAIEKIETGSITQATLNQTGYTLILETEDGTEFITNTIRGYEEKLVDLLSENSIPLEVGPGPQNKFNPLETLISFIPLIVIVGVLLYFMGGMSNFKGSKMITSIPETKLENIAGSKEAVESASEIIEYLKDDTKYKKLNAKPPQGVLLVGPPGTGKTLLARAIAGEAGIPFFSVTGSTFSDKFVGMGASKIRKLFTEAKKHKEAIIFIDEIESLGRSRGGGEGDSKNDPISRELDSMLTTLLTEIDGFEENNIIVIGATNLPQLLDPALKRRLHKTIEVPLPDIQGREQILKLHAKKHPTNPEIDWNKIAKQTTGFSGADLKLIVEDAALIATKQNADQIEEADLLEASVTLHVGKERKSAVITDFDREVTAWHEAGHTVVASKLPHALNPTYVTIIPRGVSGGHTRFDSPQENFTTKQQILHQLAVGMGGRAAEIIAYGENGYTQGASGDIEACTNQALAYVTQYGMGTRLSKISEETLRVGTNLANDVNNEVEKLLKEALKLATKTLTEHSMLLEKLKNELVVNETIEGSTLDEILTSTN